MKLKYIAAVAGLAALSSGPLSQSARADVTWEHSGSIRVSSIPGPLVKLKMFTSFAPQRERVLLKYDLNPMIPLPVASHGSAAIIQRLDDDKLIAYDSQTKKYVSESRNLLLSKLIADPWKKVAPELSEGPTPELTEEQRKRLGAEIRATISPILKHYSRTYFRVLTEKRSFNGIEGRGYRLTQLINTNEFGKTSGKWMNISFEWWLAGDLPGDEIIHGLQQQAMESLKSMGWPSKSMWSNESGYVFLYALPEAYITALKTLAPGDTFANPSFGGTPLELNATVSAPPNMGMGTGDIRFTLGLTKRYTSELPASVFEVPSGYAKFDLKPYLKQLDEAREKMTVEQIFKEIEKSAAARRPF